MINKFKESEMINGDESQSEEFLPRNDIARMAVLRSREIVRRNNEFIFSLKKDSNITEDREVEKLDAEFFSEEDSYSFDLYKIKSKRNITEFIREMFRIH